MVFWDMHIGRRTKCNFKLSIVIDQKDQYTKLNDNFRQPKRSKKSGILVFRSLKFYTCWIKLEFTMMGILTANHTSNSMIILKLIEVRLFRNWHKNYVESIVNRNKVGIFQRKSPLHPHDIYIWSPITYHSHKIDCLIITFKYEIPMKHSNQKQSNTHDTKNQYHQHHGLAWLSLSPIFTYQFWESFQRASLIYTLYEF